MSVFLKLKQSVKSLAPILNPEYQTNLMILEEKEAISHWELGVDERCYVNKIDGAPNLEVYNYGNGGSINFYAYGVNPQAASQYDFTYLDTQFKPLKQKAFTVGVVCMCQDGLLGSLSPVFSHAEGPVTTADFFKLGDTSTDTYVTGDFRSYGFKNDFIIEAKVETRKLKFMLYSTDGKGNAMLYSPSRNKEPAYSIWSGIVKDFPSSLMLGAAGTTHHNRTTVAELVIWDRQLTIEDARLAYQRAEMRIKLRGLEMYPEAIKSEINHA